MSDARTKYVFVTGGVVSALGKGIVAASLGRLLKARGLRVQGEKARNCEGGKPDQLFCAVHLDTIFAFSLGIDTRVLKQAGYADLMQMA